MILLQQVKVLQILLLNKRKKKCRHSGASFFVPIRFLSTIQLLFPAAKKATLSKPSVVFVLSVIHFG